MRKIVSGLFVSVDGVVEAPETWTGAYSSPEVGQVVGSLIAAGDTLLLRRRTYETFAQSFASDSIHMQKQANQGLGGSNVNH